MAVALLYRLNDAHLSLDAQDSSGNGHTGTMIGNYEFQVPGISYNAVHFSQGEESPLGVTGHIDVPYSALGSGKGLLSVIIISQYDSRSLESVLWGSSSESYSGLKHNPEVDPPNMQLVLEGTPILTVPDDITYGKWYTYIVTYDSGSVYNLYRNGVYLGVGGRGGLGLRSNMQVSGYGDAQLNFHGKLDNYTILQDERMTYAQVKNYEYFVRGYF